ncbi:MAG: hypothetical protein WCT03_24635 [Candidatus Obscuribacterales bacterium]|jgi:hypothetical protein
MYEFAKDKETPTINFGGNLRTQNYLDWWPYVECDGRLENFKLDELLPYEISPVLGRIFKERGIIDTEQLRGLAGDSYDIFDITLSISHGMPQIDTSPVHHLGFYIAIGLTAQQILEIFKESEQFHKDWEIAHPTDWEAISQRNKELNRCKRQHVDD